MTVCKKVFFITVAILLNNCGFQNSSTQDEIMAIDLFIEQEAKVGFSGSVLISENNKILLSKGYGWADLEQKTPNDENTVFNIASVSKLFTVVMILQLAEQDKLSLDDILSKHLGTFEAPKNWATIHHLLLHTAGLVPRGYALDYNSREGFVESVKKSPPESNPGEKYRYTNAGYTLLAAIIEEVSNMSYEDYLIKNILKPLDLQNTTFGPKDSIHNLAIGYIGKTIDSLEAYKAPNLVWGDRGPGSIHTNAKDLNSFLQGLEAQKLIKYNYLQKMYYEQIDGEAYGFHVLDKSGIGKVLTRGGGLPNFESQIAWYKDKNIRIILLINNYLRRRQPVWNGIEKILFEDKKDK